MNPVGEGQGGDQVVNSPILSGSYVKLKRNLEIIRIKVCQLSSSCSHSPASLMRLEGFCQECFRGAGTNRWHCLRANWLYCSPVGCFSQPLFCNCWQQERVSGLMETSSENSNLPVMNLGIFGSIGLHDIF